MEGQMIGMNDQDLEMVRLHMANVLKLRNLMLVIRAGIHKMFGGIANREDPDQTAEEAV